MTDYNTRVDVAHLTGQVIDLSTVGDGSIPPLKLQHGAQGPGAGYWYRGDAVWSNYLPATLIGQGAQVANTSGVARWALALAGTESGSNAGGNLQLNSFTDAGGTLSTVATFTRSTGALTLATAGATVANQSASVAALVAKGAASQTANLLEAQTSAGSMVFNVSPAGAIYSKGSLVLDGAAGTYRSIEGRTTSTRWLLALGNTAAESGANAGSDFSLLRYDDAGSYLGTAVQITRSNGAVAVNSTGTTVTNQAAATKALIVKGAASQTANLIEAQDSTGTTLGYIGAGGAARFAGSVQVSDAAGTNRQVQLLTAGLLRWSLYALNNAESGSNAGSDLVIGRYDDAGSYLGTAVQITRSNGAVAVNSTGATITNQAAATVALVVKGATSQSADLLRLQDSTPTTKLAVDSTGSLYLADGTSATITLGPTGGGAGSNNVNLRGGSGGIQWFTPSTAGVPNTGEWLIYRTSANYSPLYVRDLINSRMTAWFTAGADSAVSVVDVQARLRVNGSGSGAQLEVVSSAASKIVVYGKGAASQTADLLQLQDSAAATKAAIDPSGRMSLVGQAYLSNTGLSLTSPTTSGQGVGVKAPASFTGLYYFAQDSAGVNRWYQSAPGFTRSTVPTTSDYVLQAIVDADTNLRFQIQGDGTVSWGPGNAAVDTSLWRSGVSKLSTYAMAITNQVAATVGLVVKAAASQSANVVEVQNSAGTVVARITAGGDLYANTVNGGAPVVLPAGGAAGAPLVKNSAADYDTGWGGQLTIQASAAGTVPLISKGAASQTADLLQLKNSGGTTLFSVSAAGAPYMTGSMSIDGSAGTYRSILGRTGGTTRWLLAVGDTASEAGSNAGSDFVLLNYNDAGSNIATVMKATRSTGYVQFGFQVGVIAAPSTTVGLNVSPPSASGTGVLVKGVASQTGALLALQTSAGTTRLAAYDTGYVLHSLSAASNAFLAAIVDGDAFGRFSVDGNGSHYWGGGSGTTDLALYRTTVNALRADGSLQVVNGTTGNTALLVKGAASQTAALLDLQNSAGTSLLTVSAAGVITAGAFTGLSYGAVGGAQLASASLSVTSNAAGNVAAIIKGAASQTADLLQLQNSAGTVLTKFDAAGNCINAAGVSSSAGLFVDAASGTARVFGGRNASSVVRWYLVLGNATTESGSNAGSDFMLSRYDDAGSLLGSPLTITRSNGAAAFATTGITITNQAAATIALIVKAAASQSAALIDAQNSAGTSQFTVSAAGAVTCASITPTTDVAVADGGTGASTPQVARRNLRTVPRADRPLMALR